MNKSASSERAVYEISDPDTGGGTLVDVLGETLAYLDRRGRRDLKWAIFDLDWLQREDGILHWERVCKRTEERPNGWQLDDHGIRLFHKQSLQVIDGLFLAAADFVIWPENSTEASLILRSEIALQALDSSVWRLSCREDLVAKNVVGKFKNVIRTALES